jgi:hypothetical protein
MMRLENPREPDQSKLIDPGLGPTPKRTWVKARANVRSRAVSGMAAFGPLRREADTDLGHGDAKRTYQATTSWRHTEDRDDGDVRSIDHLAIPADLPRTVD